MPVNRQMSMQELTDRVNKLKEDKNEDRANWSCVSQDLLDKFVSKLRLRRSRGERLPAPAPAPAPEPEKKLTIEIKRPVINHPAIRMY
jgi:hypothetical protein